MKIIENAQPILSGAIKIEGYNRNGPEKEFAKARRR
jgi:hypothetical protein